LKHDYGLAPLRVRGLERIQLHTDLTLLARLSQALVRARAVPLAAWGYAPGIVDERIAVDRLKERIVDDLAQDDIGLWEPLWTLYGWYPEADKTFREAVAEKALQELHEAGRITMYRMPWATQDQGAQLPADEVQNEIGAAWWREVPLRSGDVWVTGQQAGS
jgi:hypothetical protein